MQDAHTLTERIANATVLFPSSTPHPPPTGFEIVLALCPVCTAAGQADIPAQYAMLVRRASSGEYVPLLKGEAYNRSAPFTKPLRSLFEHSARAIHTKYAGVRLPAMGYVEHLPRYESESSATTQ